jgi:hypothetical protein
MSVPNWIVSVYPTSSYAVKTVASVSCLFRSTTLMVRTVAY